jgi:hypothetical protein
MPGLREITKRQRAVERLSFPTEGYPVAYSGTDTLEPSPLALTVDQLSPPYAHLNMSPTFALTDQHVAALERAIISEGYRILVDPESGEAKLEKGEKPPKELVYSQNPHWRNQDLERMRTALLAIHHGAVCQGPHTGMSWVEVEKICKEALANAGPDTAQEYKHVEVGYEFKPDGEGNIVGNFYEKKD